MSDVIFAGAPDPLSSLYTPAISPDHAQTRNMKIIYYSPHPTHDIVSEVGYATHQREVINALRHAGHEVVPVIMGGTDEKNLNPLASVSYRPGRLKRILKQLLPSFIWTSLNNFRLLQHDVKAGKKLEEQIRLHKPDLLYERSEYLQDSGARMALKYKLRYFLEVNAPFVEEMRQFEGYSLYESKAHRVEIFKLKTAHRVFSVSSALSDFLIGRYGCERSKVILQPNCINPAKIHTDAGRIRALREQWQAQNRHIIGFVGSMFPYHGVDVLIKAFAAVHADFADSRLLIVGDGIVLGDLRKQARSLGLEKAVIFTGRIPHQQVFDYIAAMNICVMAKSNWYGSPVKLFEYGLMNKPIIAPDTAPVKDVMQHMVDAVITADSADSLEAALRLLLNDRDLASSLAAHFHQRVLAEYTWDQAAAKIIQACA